VLESGMMTDFAVEIVGAFMAALFIETNAFKKKVEEEELSLFIVVTATEASINQKIVVGEINGSRAY
jgi:hypothetical protein